MEDGEPARKIGGAREIALAQRLMAVDGLDGVS
jgi:hypothetical protein